MRVRSSVGRIDAVGPSGDVGQVAFLLSHSIVCQGIGIDFSCRRLKLLL